MLLRKTRFGAHCVKNIQIEVVDTKTVQDRLFRVHFLFVEDGCHQIKVAISIRFIGRDDRRNYLRLEEVVQILSACVVFYSKQIYQIPSLVITVYSNH